jgi:hypothetical protein
MRPSKLVEYSSNAVALLAIMFVVARGSAAAKQHKPKASAPASQVVAHSMCSIRETRASRLSISANLPSRRSFE